MYDVLEVKYWMTVVIDFGAVIVHIAVAPIVMMLESYVCQVRLCASVYQSNPFSVCLSAFLLSQLCINLTGSLCLMPG